MKDVLSANVPFSENVRNSIESSNSIPPGIKQQILDADDNTLVSPNYAFEEFLKRLPGYESLFKTLESIEKGLLEAGMNPSNSLFNKHHIFDETERLMLNKDGEIYVNGVLYKIYNECRMAAIHGNISSAYAELARLDNNGFATPPQNYTETISGISLEQMNSMFPMSYALLDYKEISNTVDNIRLDQETRIILESREICRPASFTYLLDSTSNPSSLINFSAFNPISNDNNQYYHYWTFGDGTGLA